MSTAARPPRPSPGEPAARNALAITALVAALVLGAVIAHQRAEVGIGARAAFAHPLPPPGHSHPTPTTRPPTTTRPPVCRPPHGCRPTPTTTQRPPPTTTRRPIFSFPPCFPRCGQPPPTTTARPVTTTTRRPVTTTTRRPVTTTTAAPPTTTQAQTGGDPDCTGQPWACGYVESGIDDGYLPEDYNPDADTDVGELEQILADYGEHNPGFDAEDAIGSLPDTDDADRGDMFIALAIGLGITDDPDIDPMEVADELADMGILLGLDGDGDGEANPYTEADAAPDSTMNNAQLAAFLDRIPIPDGGDGGSGPTVGRPGNNNPGRPGNPDDDVEPCTTGLWLSSNESSLFLAQLQWTTLVGIEPQGEPGRPWPPHPDVPGGTAYLVVAGSPVWPLADPQGVWYVVSDDGCLWEVVSIQTRLNQLLPWSASHRATIENADSARPGAGFGTYLSRWDNLSAAQQAQAQQHHTNRDVSAACGIETAKISVDSYARCRWELPVPGAWSWQARACFRGVAEDVTFRECATLARGVEWFLEIIDYTSGITLQHDSGTMPPAEPRRPAPAA